MSAKVSYLLIATMVLTGLYLPVLLVFYWLTHVRRQASTSHQMIRSKEMAFFFMRTLDERWRFWPNFWMSLLPSLVLSLGGGVAAISLLTLLREDVSTLLGGLALDAVVEYIRPVFFGFLGAFMFMLQTTLRRYLDDDLGIDTHIVIAVRVIMALIVSFVAGFILPTRYGELNLGTVLVYGAAFIFGVVPEQGFETLYSIVAGWLGDVIRKKTEHSGDLQKCLDFDRVRLARLSVENVKTADDLAHVEIERLAQKTRFDLQAIFYWVDRAIFYSQLKESPALNTLESQGIRTFSAFETVYRDSRTRQSIQAQVSAQAQGQKDKAGGEGTKGGVAPSGQAQNAPPRLGDTDLNVAYTAMMRLPNTQLVRLFTIYKAAQVTGSFAASNRAQVYEQMENYARAVAEYDAALERNPLDPTLLTRRGRARAMYAQQCMRQADFSDGYRAFERAAHDFQRALDILPSGWEAHLERAIMTLSLKPYLFDHGVIETNLNLAIEDLEEAKRHNTGELEIVNWLGRAYMDKEAYAKAAGLLRKAIRSTSTEVAPRVRADAELIIAQALIAQTVRASGKKQGSLLKEAQAHIKKAQGVAPRNPLLFLTQALYYHADSPSSKQEERFLELALQPGDVPERASAVEMTASFVRVRARGDRADEIYEMWGQLNLDRGDVGAAIACFTQAIAQNPARAATYERRGALYERLGDLDAAIADYDLLIETLGCETADVYLARARAESRASVHRPKQFRARVEHDVERAIALSPHRPAPFVALGDWSRLSGDYAQAIEAYEQAKEQITAQNKQNGADLIHAEADLDVGLGLAYCGLSEQKRAMRALRKADRLVGGERNRSPRLWIGWGVFYGLDMADSESHMNALDAFAHLAEAENWARVNAADLKQATDTLTTLMADETLGRESKIWLLVVQARIAALLGASDVMDVIDALRSEIEALSDEAHRADLNALLLKVDELERFV